LATAKSGGILFEITHFENLHRLKKNERITIDTKTSEYYQVLRYDSMSTLIFHLRQSIGNFLKILEGEGAGELS
jgi:hypothetical protein